MLLEAGEAHASCVAVGNIQLIGDGTPVDLELGSIETKCSGIEC